MVLVVVEHILAVAVVEMQHDELVVFLTDAEAHVDDGVEAEVPSLALNEGDVGNPAPVVR